MTHTGTQADSAAAATPPAIVNESIQRISQLATLPETTLKIIELVEDPGSSALDLVDVLKHDPALASRVVRLVNSGFYGLPGRVSSVEQAIKLLGLNALKNIAIAASLTRLFGGGQICASFDAHELWRHCIAVAIGSKLLSTHCGHVFPEEAFLAGLIHDLGILVEMQACRPQLVEIVKTVEADPQITFRAAERRAMGATHEDFGAALCRAWKFPECFTNTTGYHHRPDAADAEHGALVRIVHAADVLAARLGLGYCRTVETTQINAAMLEEMGIDQPGIDEIVAIMPEATEQTAALLRP